MGEAAASKRPGSSFPWGVYVLAAYFGFFALIGLVALIIPSALPPALCIATAGVGALLAFGMARQINWIRVLVLILIALSLAMGIPVVSWLVWQGEYGRAVKLSTSLYLSYFIWEYLRRAYVRAVFAARPTQEATVDEHS